MPRPPAPSLVLDAQGPTRRELLEWLGRGSVLALSGTLLAACGPDREDRSPDGADACAGQPGFPFSPAAQLPGAGLSSWAENTVDPLDLAAVLAGWTLRVDGMVEQPRTFTFADLVALPRQDQVTDFHCVEGWSVLDVPWNGVALARVLDAVHPTAAATHLNVHSVGGKYQESLALSVAREAHSLLAYGVDCNTLPVKHGFPLRVVVPRLLGYKNAKFVNRLELTDRPVPGFWEAYGYDAAGEVPPSRLRPGKW